jgi:hypothetical protein
MDIIKKINYTFKENLPKIFYLQDMFETFKNENVYPSNTLIIDIHNSSDEFLNNFKDGYKLSSVEFKTEYDAFYLNHKCEHETLNSFVENFKKYIEKL